MHLKSAKTLTNVKTLAVSPLKYAVSWNRIRVSTSPLMSAIYELHAHSRNGFYIGLRKGGGGRAASRSYNGGGRGRDLTGNLPARSHTHTHPRPAQDFREGGNYC